jgi:hypothetical protein
MTYAKYFQPASLNWIDITRKFPMHMSKAPARTRWANLPQRDMTMPAMRPPIGVARDGIANLAPAFAADSIRMTWNSKGRVKRNY